MTNYVTGCPELPVLSLDKISDALTLGGVGPSFAAAYTGLSRVHVSQLLNGHSSNPTKPTLDAVSTLAYRVLRAVKFGHLPREGYSGDLQRFMHDDLYDTPLSLSTPADVLPTHWLTPDNTLREQDATV